MIFSYLKRKIICPLDFLRFFSCHLTGGFLQLQMKHNKTKKFNVTDNHACFTVKNLPLLNRFQVMS